MKPKMQEKTGRLQKSTCFLGVFGAKKKYFARKSKKVLTKLL